MRYAGLILGITLVCGCGHHHGYGLNDRSREGSSLKERMKPQEMSFRSRGAATQPDVPTAADLSRYYAQVHREFKSGIFYKPSDRSAAGHELEMAPLIVQEVPGGTATATAVVRLGTVRMDASGKRLLDLGQPAVYATSSAVELSGVQYRQLIYVWAYIRESADGLYWQGFRTTLDVNGFPIISELLTGEAEPAVLFVSESLETTARESFGQPLPGRSYVVEQSTAEQPNVVVARALADGPQPMGLTVYVGADREVTTLLCRCMPAQVSDFVENTYFDLLPLETLGDVRIPADGPFHLQFGTATQPAMASAGGSTGRPWLEQVLRLPA